ncbi:catechol 1,2-dioxygenase [Azospirillum sp. TSO35-2]|uniref:catechol 1,2-dioxygenase n=1 Tax=Azospirillum sp. TSO35-2 TaxID=716796 RepID=UPI000D62139B|nr:catechol 1,2-dioxygenase [Azospirillum sp. TSO35-2]PWC31393.1 catechol 1,2-dioxygenase [Azospirillum sp. TSO35-2]
MNKTQIQDFAKRISGTRSGPANERVKAVVDRMLFDLFVLIDEMDVTPEEFWAACSYVTELGKSNEIGLLVPGLGVEHFLDLRQDEKERAAGMEGGTPRTIEGPLYVAGAPVCQGEARLDDDTDDGEILFMDGRVLDSRGNPIPGAQVEVWHANSRGNYSYFDPSQSAFNLRRTIIADAEGRYRFRSIMPSGYSCPPDGPTQTLLTLLGRHGHRPAHIHFFVSAPGYRTLTTQINIKDDPYVHDDFAFATRDGLIPDVAHHTEPAALHDMGVNRPFATITFDFTLPAAVDSIPGTLGERPRAAA